MYQNSTHDLWDIKRIFLNEYVKKESRYVQKVQHRKHIQWEINRRNFSKSLTRYSHPYRAFTPHSPYQHDQRRTSPCPLINFPTVNLKESILKNSENKCQITYVGKHTTITENTYHSEGNDMTRFMTGLKCLPIRLLRSIHIYKCNISNKK